MNHHLLSLENLLHLELYLAFRNDFRFHFFFTNMLDYFSVDHMFRIVLPCGNLLCRVSWDNPFYNVVGRVCEIVEMILKHLLVMKVRIKMERKERFSSEKVIKNSFSMDGWCEDTSFKCFFLSIGTRPYSLWAVIISPTRVLLFISGPRLSLHGLLF